AAPPGAAPARFLSAAAAWQVADILSTIPPPPGSAGAGIAWKTGTSYGHRDALAMGFDGAHVVAVWLGRADGTPMPGAFGADLAAPVLFEAFGLLAPRPARLPPAPPGVLHATTAELPPPLARFRPRGGVPDPDAPRIAFPPDGATIEPVAGRLLLRVEGGRPPFAWLADGAPLPAAGPAREAMAQAPGPGFTTLTVIDAAGRAARATVFVP
ncbi:MAG: penicillin-binding protein 1C, partial [Rhodobacteraceae bacterium]|nr:penicillin-binding protein 1C [Paracoccaceae bacterium]